MGYHRFRIKQFIDGDYTSFAAMCDDCNWIGRLKETRLAAIEEGDKHAENHPRG